MSDLRIVPAGDAALLVELPPRIDPATSARVVALARTVRERWAVTLRDIVVGYCSVTVYFDPLQLDAAWLESELRMLAEGLPDTPIAEGRLIDVPVCYGGEYGPDLAHVAAYARGSEADVVALHAGVTYRVYLIGFVPGLPYLAAVDPRLALPRRATPRTVVPAGSVAVAAGQTTIYPGGTPGGWHLIGRTRTKPYDASRADPCLFVPGDRVRFHPIDRAAFEEEGPLTNHSGALP
jgi:KipI family sensor histidine kinase inhibitor